MNNFKGFEGFDEVVKYCKRKNLIADRSEADGEIFWHANKVAREMEEKKGVQRLIGQESVFPLSFDELNKELHRAYWKGLEKGREQGGLEPL